MKRVEQSHDIAGAMVIDVRSAQNLACELLQEVIFFVCGVVRADDAEFAVPGQHFAEFLGDGRERNGP